jgi:thiamine-phosphate pyrophosphorylase
MNELIDKKESKLGPVYPITDSPQKTGRSYVQQVRIFLESGIKFFQLRDKETEDRDLLKQLLEIRALSESYDACFIINDRIDLALASKATGVHLGQTDLPVTTARQLLGNQAIIGLSTHNEDQFRKSLELPADYIAIGPVFTTSTKESSAPSLGTQILREFSAVIDRPLVAIGGITADNITEVLDCGADSAAMISAISLAPDPKTQLSRLIGMCVR